MALAGEFRSRGEAGCETRGGGWASPYFAPPASIAVPGAATINRPSRVTVNSPDSPGRESTAKQRHGAGAGEIDAAPLKAGAQRARAFAHPAQNLLEPARITNPAGAKNGGIGDACGIGGHQFASLHAFDIDEAQAVAGMNRYGNGAGAGDPIALLARSERASAGTQDDRRPGRPRRDQLVAQNLQRGVPSFGQRSSDAS